VDKFIFSQVAMVQDTAGWCGESCNILCNTTAFTLLLQATACT